MWSEQSTCHLRSAASDSFSQPHMRRAAYFGILSEKGGRNKSDLRRFVKPVPGVVRMTERYVTGFA